MTKAFAAQTTIDRPVAVVWARLVDWDSAPTWMPGVEALRADGPTAPGTALIFRSRGKERVGHIWAMDPGHGIPVRSVQGGVTADYVYSCRAERVGTLVTLEADCRFAGPVRLLAPLIRAAIRRADGGQLQRFAATFPA